MRFTFSNLKGEKGDTGPQGEQGIQGLKGEKGEKGDPGRDGVDGKDGKDGRDGTDLGAYVTPTTSGSITSFDDGADNIPVKSLVVDIVPVQAGGDPSPTNIRPISGRTSVQITRAGEGGSNAQTYNISLAAAGTVYDGKLDVTNGVLTVDKEMVTLNTANMDNGEQYPGWKNAGARKILGPDINSIMSVIGNVGKQVGINTSAANGANFDIMWLPVSTYGKTQSEWQALALDVQILLPYTTPLTYQLDPIEVNTLLGVNNLYADAGGVEVSYRADPTIIYNKIMNAITNLSVNLVDADAALNEVGVI